MSIRKEQMLFLVVVALGVWYWTSLGAEAMPSRVQNKTATAPEHQSVLAVLAAANPNAQPVVPGPDREPSESSPLPPRELPLTDLAKLPVVLPPLDPGPLPGQYYLLRADLAPMAPAHQFSAVDAGAAAATDAQAGPVREVSAPDALEFADGNRLQVEILSGNKIQLAEMSVVNVEIRYHWISPKDGTIVQADRVAKPGEVRRVVLADTRENWALRNEWHLRGQGLASLPARKDFVLDLLKLAPAYPEFYAKAELQAQQIVTVAPGVEGYRWMQRVLRAQGDLEREWQLYAGANVSAQIASTSFLHRGKGEVESMLGLWGDAEADLRRAVEIEARNPRSNAALARFLLRRGRAREAEPFAAAAAEARAIVPEADENYEVSAVYVETLLALGRLDDARTAVRSISAQNGQAAALDYLRGCVDYARRDLAAARGQFRQATSDSGGDARARLGLGLCALAEQSWDEAKTILESVVRSAPLLRGRGHAALGLLYMVTGHPGLAATHLEAARLAAPDDAYTLYLNGYRKRLAGDLDGAIQSHRNALAQRDDLVESLAEITLALRAQSVAGSEYGAGDGDPAAVLGRAARYADRAVQLDAARGDLNLLTELQGQVKLALRDMAGARDAFSRALERGSDVGLIGLATIDYQQNRAADARDAFVALGNDTTRPAAVQAFARGVVDLIDDHADKQQLRDGFERAELGEIWDKQRSDRAAPTVVDGRLRIAGNMKATPAFVRRSLQRGGQFLKVATTLKVHPTPGFTFAGIRLSASGRGAANRFSMRLGVHSLTQGLQPHLSIHDGRPREGETPNQALDVPGFDPSGEHRIEIEATEGSKPSTFRLAVRWNGVEVFARDDLRTLRPSSQFAFEIDLMAEARGEVDVAFDDFLLHRRQPK